MKITSSNYEAFFLDFVEGRLDNSSTLELLNFLRNHPELKQELESFSDVRLETPEEIFPGKEFLKKMDFGKASVNPNNFDDFCIGYYERVLNSSEIEKLFAYLEQHPDKKKHFDLFGKTTLVADQNIVFEAKPFLKRKLKRANLKTVVLRITAVAAGLLLAVAIYYKATVKDDIQTGTTIANNHPVEPVRDNQSTNTVEVAKNIENNSGAVKKSIAPKFRATTKLPSKGEEIIKEDRSVSQDLEMLAAISISPLPNTAMERPQLRPAENITIPDPDKKEDLELFAYAQKLIQKKILKQDEDKPKKKITLWDLADVTIKGYNSITENDIKLHKETDENGNVTAFAIETENKKYGFSNKN